MTRKKIIRRSARCEYCGYVVEAEAKRGEDVYRALMAKLDALHWHYVPTWAGTACSECYDKHYDKR